MITLYKSMGQFSVLSYQIYCNVMHVAQHTHTHTASNLIGYDKLPDHLKVTQ